MSANTPKLVALIGTGVIGRGWIRVFAARGAQVRLYDSDPGGADRALHWLRQDLEADRADGFLSSEEAVGILGRVRAEADIAAALRSAEYVQESAPERIEVKRALFAELDGLSAPDAILASSTSALDIGEIAGGLPGERRCVMAHPFNPPHLLPVVEMLGAPRTDPAVLERACAILTACGQIPVRMNRYVKGFLGNRIQAAVVREALHLVETGVADPVAVDAVIRDALALRWATIGNFGANHTNADEGIAQYFARYANAYRGLMEDLDETPPRFDDGVLKRVGEAVERREGVRSVAELCRKRDVMVKRLRKLKDAEERRR
ncbi:MAG: 3-hydroxyacyl-CoA dehydrogenase NAD-binding [Rhodospirillales bacterium]|nr:3-hydroxyacyl-CoA dehydrogenase NAD-binding [Rhodospirillales bacterium]